MGLETGISWADSTLNIWMGCQETASIACVGCYARQLVEGRFGLTTWGPDGERVETKSWRANLRKISREAKKAGRPWFVFVNSLSDFWDNKADPALRAEALTEFRKHPHLIFLLLTKRPQNIAKMVKNMAEADLGVYADAEGGIASWWPRNCAIGCTVVTQEEANRDVPWLLRAKAALKPAFAFLSMEPLVEVVDLRWLDISNGGVWTHINGLAGWGPPETRAGIDWVISGGMTDQGAHKAFPTPIEAFRTLRDHCAVEGVAFHHKQNGEWITPTELQPVALPLKTYEMHESGAIRLGKKLTGRHLDGVVHDARPHVPLEIAA